MQYKIFRTEDGYEDIAMCEDIVDAVAIAVRHGAVILDTTTGRVL
jgi:hypothetical protein